ncbi:MAG: pyruvate formate lyase family protein [Candidatus Alcyoniella australis]|nr:pyruvate formate lyase family protein [Candidatus Alcyoniella australis]
MTAEAAHVLEDLGQPRPSERIKRLQRRYQSGEAHISVERARYFTHSWQDTQDHDMSRNLRVALAMRRVYERMTIHLDPDDRIAGYWTEHFLGAPVIIERGEYNRVLEAELTKPRMAAFRAASAAKALKYLLRKGKLGELIHNQRLANRAGAQPMNMGLQTMDRREVNPFQIDPADRRELLGELLPYWRDRCLADVLEQRLAQSGLYSEEMHDFATALPGNTSRQVIMLATCATCATIQGHVILDYQNALDNGLEAMLAQVLHQLEQDGLSQEQRDFLLSIRHALEGVETYARRLAVKVREAADIERDPGRRAELERMARDCERVPLKPPQTFAQAVQALWTLKTAVELAHPMNLHCFGRLDQILYPYYRADLEAGRTDPAAACELIEELLLKLMSQNIRLESNMLSHFYHRFLGSTPVTIGGLTPEGKDGTNALTYLFLRAAHNSKAITNISLRVHKKTPDELLHVMADYLQQGTSSYALFNDEVNVPAMRNSGFAERDAHDYAVMGCVEMTCPGRTGSMSANALLLSRVLDITLRNGDAATMAGTIHGEGLQTGDPDTFGDYAELEDAFIKQAQFFVDKIVRGSNLRDELHAELLPAPYISAFMHGCQKSMRDVTHGGADYDLSGISFINSIANLSDSLYVIKKLVFEQRAFSVKQLLQAVDNDFVGHEELLEQIQGLGGMWGNGEPQSDELARRVSERLFKLTHDHRSFKGGPFVPYVISMTTHTIDGRLSIATPDGRRAATPFAASCNPYNVERQGVTAALRSVATLPFEHVLGCAVNIKFHPSGVGQTRTARDKWIQLIRAYFAMGGSQLQPTVASSQMLRDAQRNPEQYRDLIVKVGGYSTYFVDMGREIQQEVIDRTEHGEI